MRGKNERHFKGIKQNLLGHLQVSRDPFLPKVATEEDQFQVQALLVVDL